MELPPTFGEWLKQRRKTLDLTQEELAKRAGCSVFALRKIEAGERRPSKQLAGLLATALEVREEELPAFIRVARGDLNPERLPKSNPDAPLASISSLIARQQTRESRPSHADESTAPFVDLEPAPHSLPSPPTQLIGRASELAAIERLFADSKCRLLTLTGLGGIGKTRLAIEFASHQRGMFPGGIFYIPLAPLNSPDLIVPAMAEVLNFVFSGPMEPKDQLINYMAREIDHPSLVVLDNLEHLLVRDDVPKSKTDAVGFVAELLERLPQIRILTTSRERLNLRGEWTYAIHGLSVPPADFLGKLEGYSAVALFTQSAQQVRAEFEASEDEQAAIIQICHLLEGIPLAIELAAAWVGMLSCAEIAQEIESNIDFLTTSMRDVPERHRSIRASFDHSWKLLSSQERDALSRLSIFRGGFDRMAAEQVTGADLPLLASLLSKSLIRQTDKGRYDLHEVIRQYALAHMEQDNSRCVESCERHGKYYLEFASRHEKELKSAAQQAAIHELTIELDNLRTAWSWGIQSEDFEAIAGAVRSLGWFYEISGLYQDGIDQLELLVQALIAKPRNLPMNKALSVAFMQQGLLSFRIGQFTRAQDLYQKSIELLRPMNEQLLLADALIFKGIIMHLNGDFFEAKELMQEGLRHAQSTGDRWFTAYGIYGLGHVRSMLGEYQKGYEQMLEGIGIWRDVGDPHAISLGLNFLVNTQIKLERYAEARASMQENILLCERTKNRWGVGTAYRYLGLATLAEGQYMEAEGYFQKSLEVFGENFEGWDIATSLVYLGDAARLSGDAARSEVIYRNAIRQALNAQAVSIATEALAGMAQLFEQSGNIEQALELSYHVLNHPVSMQETKDRVSQVIWKAESRISEERVQTIKNGLSHQPLEELAGRFMDN